MMRSLSISKTGLEAQQTQLDVISNNLANVSTNGFKRQRGIFEDLLYQTLRAPGTNSSQQNTIPTGLQLGTGVRPVATGRIHTQGTLQSTSNSLDMAINGAGYFQIQMADGTTSYTRDGAFSVDAQGQVVNANGHLLQPGVTIPQNSQSITIGADGTVSVRVAGQQNAQTVGTIQLANFVNPQGLLSLGGNLFAETAASGTALTGQPGQNGIGALNQGYVEQSNVNVVEEMVNMIQTQRAFEINARSITTSDQMLQKLTQL